MEPTGEYTDRGYTGHLGNNSGSNDLGLIYMNARYYVPTLNRHLSADTIVPDPGNPQSYNRYSYVLNSPLNFTDPSGHCATDEYDEYYDYECWELANQMSEEFGLSLEHLGKLTLEQLQKQDYSRLLAYVLGESDMVKNGQLSDADAMINILKYAVEDISSGNVHAAFEILASVFFAEIPFNNNVLSEYNYLGYVNSDGIFKSTGFDEVFANPGNDNQVSHFINEAAFTILIAGGNETIGKVGVWVQELRDINSPNYDADLALGNLAVDFASNLVSHYYAPGPISPSDPYSNLSNTVKNGN